MKYENIEKMINRNNENQEINKYRIFILGAGFSVPARLPLGGELFKLVKQQIEKSEGLETKFHQSLDEFVQYKTNKDNIQCNVDDVDLEEFMSFLDIEHFLKLEGSDTFSEHGNAAQLYIKRYIGKVIQNRTPTADNLPEEYYEFAKKLQPHDIVITLNYDIILERALEYIGKPYRLFLNRLESIGETSSTIDNSKHEVTILKLHGSVDWFSNSIYTHRINAFKKAGSTDFPHDPIFSKGGRYQSYPLVNGPRQPDDPLSKLFRIKKIDEFYQHNSPPDIPMLLSPSHMKIVYASPFMEFWYGMGQSGAWNSSLSIIGFSLPEHDEYIRVALHKMIRNYQYFSWEDELFDGYKDNVKIVDFKTSDSEIDELKKTYSFVDYKKAELYTKGFSLDAVKFLFENKRNP